MTVPIDPSRRGTSRRRPASRGSAQISSETSKLLDVGPYLHPPGQGWREPMIRRAAYLRSLNRGFESGRELEDWLVAEHEIEDLIACGAAPYR